MKPTPEQALDTVLATGECLGWKLMELYPHPERGWSCTFCFHEEKEEDNSGLYGDGKSPREALLHALTRIVACK